MNENQMTDEPVAAQDSYVRPSLIEIGSFRDHTRGINGTTWEPQPLTWAGP